MNERIQTHFRMVQVGEKDSYLAVISKLPSGDYKAEVGVLRTSATGGSMNEACNNLMAKLNPGWNK